MAFEIKIILSCLIAYLLGSLSGGIIISRIAHGPDLHTVGSKSTGASNVQRTMGWKYGLITFFFDVIKGVLSCLIAQWISGNHPNAHFVVLLAGLFCVIGHNWPVFFGFKGGKGVASSCGVMIYCFPIPALICFGIAILVIALTKFISLGSMCMLTLYAILVSLFYSNGNWWIILWAVILAILCIIRHRANIQRLLHGTENKFGQKISGTSK